MPLRLWDVNWKIDSIVSTFFTNELSKRPDVLCTISLSNSIESQDLFFEILEFIIKLDTEDIGLDGFDIMDMITEVSQII